MPTVAVPGFVPSQHGFPFPNWYPPGTPVLTVPTPFGRVPVGDANGGLCGGMIFAARDLFAHGMVPPPAPDPPVVRYLCRRLLDSFNLPFGVLKYYDWQRRPGRGRYVAGVCVQDGLSRLTAEVEWPKVRALLDAGQLAALGLVKAHSLDPREMGKNHQVLAHGYAFDDATGDVVLTVYDPNCPGDDGVTLAFNVADPESGRGVVHSGEGESVRGLFLTDYTPAVPDI
jgi:hypothetical protein